MPIRLAAATRISAATAFVAATLAARRCPKVVDGLVLAAILTVGIGHGAADDALLADRLASRGIHRRTISLVYGATAALTWALARRDAARTRIVLRLLTWFHFGSADIAFTRIGNARVPPSLRWMLAGAIPLGAAIPRLRAPATSLALFVAIRELRRGSWGGATDIGVPAVMFAVAPNERTFAAYFALWHAPRHIAVVLASHGLDTPHRERLRRFARAAAPNAAIALAAGAAIILAQRGGRIHVRPLPRIEPAILAITVPHLIAVAWLDALARAA